jgi:hypothetical protein
MNGSTEATGEAVQKQPGKRPIRNSRDWISRDANQTTAVAAAVAVAVAVAAAVLVID